MSTHRLETRIAQLRGQVRRLLVLYGMSWVVGLLIPLVILAGLADWLVHLDAALRVIALVLIVAAAGWLLARYVVTPLVARFEDLDIALRIEERWPGLNDRLTSTVQFLHVAPGDDRYGSAILRDATVRQTVEETKFIDFRRAIEPKPVVRSLAVASASLFAGLLLFAASPQLSTIALKRLFLPLGSTRWPQMTHLTLLANETPRKVARGDAFTLGVAIGKNDRVPTAAKVTYRFEDGEVVTESLRAIEGGTFRGRIETVTRPFTFSVAAGDDVSSIRNIAVAVVPPPALKDLSITLVAPDYTGLEPATMAPGRTQIRAVEGTRVEVRAAANKRLKTAVLYLGDSPSQGEVAFDSARTQFTTHFLVKESTPFWFDLRDTEGFRSREAVRIDLRAVRDEAPRVVIDEPANDRDVPAQATVPVTFSVDDDFGIQSARLLYKVARGDSEPSQEVALPLFDGQGRARGPLKHHEVHYAWNLAPLKLTPGAVITFHAEARDFDSLKGPNLGKSRELRLRVLTDEDISRQLDDQRREIREAAARVLAMQEQAKLPVDDALRTLQKTEQVSDQKREDLKNAEMTQRQVGNQINNRTDGLDQKVKHFIEDLKNFKIENADARKQMEEMRDGVARIRENHLGPAEQGLTRSTKRLDEAAREAGNGQPAPPEEGDRKPGDAEKGGEPKPSEKGVAPKDRAADAAKGQAPSHDGPKPQAGAESAKGQAPTKDEQNRQGQAGDGSKSPEKGAGKQQPPQPGAPSKRSTESAKADLAEAQQNQEAVVAELRKMLDGLSEFETYRGVVKDAQNLLKEQEQVMKQRADEANKPDLAGKTPDALTPEQKADLSNLAARQGQVAKGLQNLLEKMGEMAKRLDEAEPLAAAALRDAAEDARKQATAAKLGEAADQLEKNQMGAAQSNQERGKQDLKNLVDSIQNRRERELSRLVKELKNAEADLKKLRERQAENLKKTQQAQKNPDAKERAEQLKRLAKEQQEIQDEMKRQLKRLTKLNAESAARAGNKAAAKMGKAQQDLEQDEADQAGKDQEDALADLEEAEERTREARKDAEEMLAMEQLQKMGDQLKSVAERQEKMVKDVVEFEKLRVSSRDNLTLAQKKGVRRLGRVQEGIKEETDELAERLEGAPVFGLTLKRAAEAMKTAAQGLQSIKTDSATLAATQTAANRFKQLLESLRLDPAKPGDQQNGGGENGGGEGGGGGNRPGDGIPAFAQVKMLKSLQQEINERTEFFDELRRRNKPLSPEQTAELERLQTEQGTVADLARDLTRPKRDDGED
ncbi:MAG: DUF4175 domain-containing protein [Isosphaeraceae bacterium]|nr:DUF4175 domain-containing protein [Isosphaeraceae bacterium]